MLYSGTVSRNNKRAFNPHTLKGFKVGSFTLNLVWNKYLKGVLFASLWSSAADRFLLPHSTATFSYRALGLPHI